jgi:uncharacterized protein YkwD
MQRRLAHLSLALALAAGLLASTAIANDPVAVEGGCPTGIGLDAPAAAQKSAMLCLVSEARQRYGLPALTPSTTLDGSAIEKSRDLQRCNEFSHTACGREFSFWIHESGYMSAECWRVGENLAWGVDGQGTVAATFRAWMRSDTHRKNILGDFEETGIDLRVGQLGGLTGVHLWTQHFGSHCGS